jgi:hypothetical protein
MLGTCKLAGTLMRRYDDDLHRIRRGHPSEAVTCPESTGLLRLDQNLEPVLKWHVALPK